MISASASLLSGPGAEFYPTDTLAEGDAVDVYRQTSSGWCAVRPPAGSFSWIFGRHVRLGTAADGELVAEIEQEEVASRIGSRLSSHRNAVQVRLKKGELLHVIGEEQLNGETWYKVSPPAGEFRWVHGSALERIGPLNSTGSTATEYHDERDRPSPATIQTAATSVSNAIATEPIPTPVETGQPKSDTSVPAVQPVTAAEALAPTQSPPEQWRAAPESAPGAASAVPPLTKIEPITPIGGDDAPAAGGATGEAARTSSAGNALPASPPQTTSATVIPIAPKPASQAPPSTTAVAGANTSVAASQSSNSQTLAQIELRLSRMVAEPPATWNTAPLQAEAERLLGQTQTPVDRAAIQATIAKIDRFASIERRHRGIAPGDAQGYDAIGVLRPVNSRRPGAPPFALVDERGQVVSFVTPTPGVNLQPFLGQRIGVSGTRGYIPEFQRGHVVAGHVSPVVERIVR